MYKHNNRVLSFKVNNFITRYHSYLFPDGETLSSHLMIAYLHKVFDKLIFDIGEDAEFDIPGDLVIKHTDTLSYKMYIDLIYIKKQKGSWDTDKIGYVILVPPCNWNIYDLSNRFENVLISRYVSLQTRPNDSNCSFEITYLNPKAAKKYTISGKNLYQRYKPDIRRIETLSQAIINKDFGRRPDGCKCPSCPVLEKCNPMNFGKNAESTLMPPLIIP